MHKPLLIPLALAAAATVLAAHTACSTSGTSFERGTLTRPPAPARPGVGAPTYDPQVKPLPHQPNPKPTRALPPTMEPGIWASKAPETGPVLKLFGAPVTPPLDEPARRLTTWCIKQAHRRYTEDAFKDKSEEWRLCDGVVDMGIINIGEAILDAVDTTGVRQ